MEIEGEGDYFWKILSAENLSKSLHGINNFLTEKWYLDRLLMTMTYKVANPDLLQGLSVGDDVGFDVQEQGSDYVVTAIRKEAE